MKRSRAIALVVLLAAIAVAAFFALRPGERVYQGKSVSEWIADLGSNEIDPAAAEKAGVK